MHGGDEYADDKCVFIKEAGEYERLYGLDDLGVEDLEKFKREATSILESVKFPVHKWQSDVEHLESKDSTNPSQGQQKHPRVQWKDSRLQPFFTLKGGCLRRNVSLMRTTDNAPGNCKHNGTCTN